MENKTENELEKQTAAAGSEAFEEAGADRETDGRAPKDGVPEEALCDRAEPEEDGAQTSGEPEGEPGARDAKGAEPEKKGFFGKKKEKKDARDAQIEDLTDRLKRSMAEFDNFRKRTDKEKSAMYEIGARDIIEKILPVVDNFERGLATVPEDEKEKPFAEGMEKIYKQLMKALEELGVKPIEAVGKEFDPNIHNAVMHVEDESLGESIVSAELQKGYMYRETVVRHSMVQVAN